MAEDRTAATALPPCPWCGGKLDQRDDEPVICENGCEKHPSLGPLGTGEELWDEWNDHLSGRESSALTSLPSGRDPHHPMNPWIEQEQRSIERFVKAEYWRLARLGDDRFAFTRAPLRAES